LRFGSVCSGMEAASLAWGPLGWECAFVSEIDKAPCALLAQRFPNTPNLGDMTKFEEWPDYAIDLLAGGTPCQSFSVAGLRKGLTDPRGNLMLTFGAIAQRYRPTWLLWENVPGVLSSNGGRDFGAFLGMLAELGYGFAYRVLDAQFFGLAQRRKRVFVVGYLGDWRPPAAVLFEPESLRGDSAPRRETGQGSTYSVAPSLTGSGRGVERAGESRGQDPLVACYGGNNTKGGSGHGDFETETFVTHELRADGFDASEDGTGRGTPLVPVAFSCKDHGADAGGIAPTLRAMGHDGSHANAGATRENPDSGPDGVGVQLHIAYTLEARAEVQAVAFDTTQITNAMNRSQPEAGKPCHPITAEGHAPAVAYSFALRGRDGGAQVEINGDGDKAGALRAAGGGSSRDYVATQWAVRRLTPMECERLQGAPDDWTLVTHRGKLMADGNRYKMIGNSWAVPCVRWIGERIDLVQSELDKAA
jgi:DNA (cytosine-5)-methyltransferase 1